MLEIPLLYKDRRLEGETTLRQCQLVQLHLLYVFDAICKEYNLTYFLGGGTLLGAMRHGGFIPWDDDLDVGMPMKDYKKFLKIAPNVLPKDVLLQTPKTNPNTAIPFSKLRDAYSFYYEMRPDIATSDFAGIFLDVFPYEEMPNIGRSLEIFLLRAVFHCYQWKKKSLHCWKCNALIASLGVVINRFYSTLYCLIRFTIESLKVVFPPKTTFIQFDNGYRARYETSKIYPTVTVKFEDGEFPIPNNPNAFLVAQYGNWTEVPPPEKRPRHATIILPTLAQNLPEAMEYPLNA